MKKEPRAYIAKKSCGCIVAATVDDPEHKEDVAKNVSDWIKDGLSIERVTCETVRQSKLGCHCGQRRQPKTQLKLL